MTALYCVQDPRDADDAVRKLDGFKGWVRAPALTLGNNKKDNMQDLYECGIMGGLCSAVVRACTTQLHYPHSAEGVR